ncbi:MAG: hypothetical protein LBQ12_06900, partial [Deltaproteobacteria bacterium]|nr:hypothetical protein [Deltaproteobacteria bacterium]
MPERRRDLVGPDAGTADASGFHSFAAGIFLAEGWRAGRPQDFTLIDTADSEHLAVLAAGEAGLDEIVALSGPASLAKIISRSANFNISVEVAAREAAGGPALRDAVFRIAEGYAGLKRDPRYMDFDDLPVKLAAMMGDPETRAVVAGRFSRALAVSPRTLNPLQVKIAWRLPEYRWNVCAAGDVPQSVYWFRGSGVRSIRDFPELFAPAAAVKLEDNYRRLGAVGDGATSF